MSQKKAKATFQENNSAIVRKSKKEPFIPARDILNDISTQFSQIYRTGSYDNVLVMKSSLDALVERSHIYQKKNTIKRLTFECTHKDIDLILKNNILEWWDNGKSYGGGCSTAKMSYIKLTLF